MAGYILRRVGIAIVLIWILSVITFAIYLKVPADPAGFIVDIQHASPAQIAHAHHILGTDRPAIVQYAKYMERLLHGDFGVSWPTVVFFNGQVHGASVGQMVWKALLVTGSLALGGFVLLLLVAVPLGTFAATRPRSLFDRLSLGLSSRRSRRTRSSSVCSCSSSSGTSGSCCPRRGTARSARLRRPS